MAAMEPKTERHKPKFLPIATMAPSSDMKVVLPIGQGYIPPTSKAPIGKVFLPQRTVEKRPSVKSSNVDVAKHPLLVAKVRQPSISMTPAAKSTMIARGIFAGPPTTKYSGKYVSPPVTKSWHFARTIKRVAAVEKAGTPAVALHDCETIIVKESDEHLHQQVPGRETSTK